MVGINFVPCMNACIDNERFLPCIDTEQFLIEQLFVSLRLVGGINVCNRVISGC